MTHKTANLNSTNSIWTLLEVSASQMDQSVDGFSKRLLLDQLKELLLHKIHNPSDNQVVQNSFGLGAGISKTLHGKISRIRGSAC